MAKRKDRRERKRVSARKRAETHTSGFERTAVRLPDGVNAFRVEKEGTKRIEIIPYTVPDGAGNPYADDGDSHMERTFWAHRAVGANNDTYVCPAKTHKKRCPICEDRTRMSQESGDTEMDQKEIEERIKALAPKERQLWNVYDHADPDKGVQIWDVSYHLFGKQLDKEIKDADEDDGYEWYADPDQGMTIRVGFEEKSFGKGRPFYDAATINFKPRREPLDEEILDAANVLDDLLIVLDYDELKKIYLQMDDKKDDDAGKADDADESPKARGVKTKKSKSKKKKEEKPAPEPEPKNDIPTAESRGIKKGAEVVYNGVECIVGKISPDGTSLTLIDDDGEVYKAVGVDDLGGGSMDDDGDDVPFEDDADDPINGESAPDVAQNSGNITASSDDSDGDENWDEDWD